MVHNRVSECAGVVYSRIRRGQEKHGQKCAKLAVLDVRSYTRAPRPLVENHVFACQVSRLRRGNAFPLRF